MAIISIIIPIYNVEKYIEQCVRSLFEQTLEDLEYIFVNDCTPDKSIDILRQVLTCYSQRTNQVKILNNTTNLGQSGSRKCGIKEATGDYVIHCDSDDWVEKDWLEQMYNKAIEENADIVMCDFFKNYPDGREIVMNMADDTEKNKAFANLYTSARMGSLCGHMVKRDIVQSEDIFWPTWNYTEDTTLVFQYYMRASKLTSVHQPLYHYRDNQQSVSYSKYEILREDIKKTQKLIEQWCLKMNIWDTLLPQRLFMKFQDKARAVGMCDGSDSEAEKKWLETEGKLGFSSLLKADMTIKSKIYASIMLLHLFPLTNKIFDIRHRIWS